MDGHFTSHLVLPLACPRVWRLSSSAVARHPEAPCPGGDMGAPFSGFLVCWPLWALGSRTSPWKSQWTLGSFFLAPAQGCAVASLQSPALGRVLSLRLPEPAHWPLAGSAVHSSWPPAQSCPPPAPAHTPCPPSSISQIKPCFTSEIMYHPQVPYK